MVVVDSYRYTCELCQQRFPTFDAKINHIIAKHAQQKQKQETSAQNKSNKGFFMRRVMSKFGGKRKMEDEEHSSMTEDEIKLMREFMQNSDTRFEQIENALQHLDSMFKGLPAEVLQDINKLPRRAVNPGEKVQEVTIHTTQKHIGRLFELLNDNPDKFILKTNKMITSD